MEKTEKSKTAKKFEQLTGSHKLLLNQIELLFGKKFILGNEIINLIYEYCEIIGGSINLRIENTKLNTYATQGNIEQCEKLLKVGYYIDQWANMDKETPLLNAIYSNNVEIVEFFLLNGARRRIKRYHTLLHTVHMEKINALDTDVKKEMIKLLKPLLDQDPVIKK